MNQANPQFLKNKAKKNAARKVVLGMNPPGSSNLTIAISVKHQLPDSIWV